MRKRTETEATNLVAFPGKRWDTDATRRASAHLAALGDVLREPSVSVLAREVISRLAARIDEPELQHTIAEDLADALASRDDTAAMRKVMRLVAAGHDVETLYLTYLAGAAHLLGKRWTQDALSSAQVTIAAARIYAIMRGLASALTPTSWPDGRHAVFASVPGERHTLGVSMAADLFRHEGWLIDLKVGRTHDELLTELAESDFAILGLSVSTPDCLQGLIRLTTAVRVAHPHVLILVSGRLPEIESRLKDLTHADAVASEFDIVRAIMSEFHDIVAARSGVVRGEG